MKKKTRGKTAKKKTAKKKAASKKQADAAQVHQDIAGMVKAEAREITDAVIAQAMNGELAPAKYLFEMAGLYPPATDGSQASSEEDCLAKTLLDRLSPPQKKPSAVEEAGAAATPEAGDEDKSNRQKSADPVAAEELAPGSGNE